MIPDGHVKNCVDGCLCYQYISQSIKVSEGIINRKRIIIDFLIRSGVGKIVIRSSQNTFVLIAQERKLL